MVLVHSSASYDKECCIFSDMCTSFGGQFGGNLLKLLESKPKIEDLLTEGRRCKTNKTKSLSVWATKEIRKLKNRA